MNITSKGAMMALCPSPEFPWHSYSAKNNQLRDYGSGKPINYFCWVSLNLTMFRNHLRTFYVSQCEPVTSKAVWILTKGAKLENILVEDL